MAFARPINTKGQPPIVTSEFGPNHKGTDYGYPDGTPVYASESGKVVIAKNDEVRQWIANSSNDPFPRPRQLRTEDYGNMVKIEHSDGYTSLYAHMKHKSVTVTPGVQVKKGQKIGEVGSTGNSIGNHLHFEIRKHESAVNPAPLLDTGFWQVTPQEDPRAKKIRELEADKEQLWKEKTEWEHKAKDNDFAYQEARAKYNGLRDGLVQLCKQHGING